MKYPSNQIELNELKRKGWRFESRWKKDKSNLETLALSPSGKLYKVNEKTFVLELLKNPNSTQLAKCRKVLAEQERETHKPTISHYRDMKNGKVTNPTLAVITKKNVVYTITQGWGGNGEKVYIVWANGKNDNTKPIRERLNVETRFNSLAELKSYLKYGSGFTAKELSVIQNGTTATAKNPSVSTYKSKIEKLPLRSSLRRELISIYKELVELKKQAKSKYADSSYFKPRIERLEKAIKQGLASAKNPATATVKRASNPNKKDIPSKSLLDLIFKIDDNGGKLRLGVLSDKEIKLVNTESKYFRIHGYFLYNSSLAKERLPLQNPNNKTSTEKITAQEIAKHFNGFKGQNLELFIHQVKALLGYRFNYTDKTIARAWEILNNKKIPTRKPNFSNTDFNSFVQATTRKNSRMFQGKLTGEQTQLIAPNGTPKNLSRLGALKLMIVKMPNGEKANITFDKNAYLAMDIRKNLHCIGNGAKINGIKVKGNGLAELGRLIQIDYVTDKKHINGNKLTHFYHKLGEVTGETPRLFVDTERFPIIHGGNYDVWSVGIVN